MSLYAGVLFVHSFLRWLVLCLLVAVTARSFLAWRRSHDWSRAHDRAHVALVKVVYVQFLLGLILYVFLSPFSAAFLANVGASLKQPVLRFFGLEHGFTMFAAVGVIHEGRKRSSRAATPRLRHRQVWITTLIALLLICAAIPWPFLQHGRPLFRVAASTAAEGGPSAHITGSAGWPNSSAASAFGFAGRPRLRGWAALLDDPGCRRPSSASRLVSASSSAAKILA
jgi:hypothetical protein